MKDLMQLLGALIVAAMAFMGAGATGAAIRIAFGGSPEVAVINGVHYKVVPVTP